MKIYSVILILSLFFLFGGSQNDISKTPADGAEQDCIEAIDAQEVQSFYSENPESQFRNHAEFWDDGVYLPSINMK